MTPSAEHVQQYLLGPIVNQWFARFAAAAHAKERFNTMMALCRQFLGSSAKAMWEDDFRRQFYPSVQQPQFMVSLNKAFELVAIIGPSLYWQNPQRQVKSPEAPDQARIAQMFGVTDETMLQMIQQKQQSDNEARVLRNSLASVYLEYAGREQPGHIKADVEMICQDALVTGLGLGWTETYSNRVTGEMLTGTFFDPVDNLLIDPDAKDPQWRDAKWIARRHVEDIWKVERRFGYPSGYLQGRGTGCSSEHLAKLQVLPQGQSMYQDQIEWFEVWSCAGIGARVTGSDPQMGQALDQLTGDYAYLCVSRNVPHPLNLPPLLVKDGLPDQITDALRWRSSRFGSVNELWKDRRWPVTPLSFYPIVGSVWPMAVLGPGIGALLAMNLLLVSQLSMSWDRRRDILAVYEHLAANVEAAIKSEDNPAVIRINSASEMKIDEVVKFVQRPDIQGNLIEWIEYLDNQFQMATGLDDIHYGISQKQARVNSDVQAKQAASNVRPEKMATDVHQFIVDTSTVELWLAAQHVKGAQLHSLLGDWGVMAWDNLMTTMPLEELAKEMAVYVEATDMRRPNREKDMADLEKIAPYVMPAYIANMPLSGDSAPFNAFMAKFFEAMNMKGAEDLYLGEWVPPVDPAAQQMQQQMQQLEAAKLQAETEETQAKSAARLTDAMYKQQGAAAPAAQKLRWTELMNQQKLKMEEQAHLQQMIHLQEQQDIQIAGAKAKASAGGK